MKRARCPRLFAKRFLRDERGAVTIEFVVTLPMFLAALAFSYEFGQLFLAQQSTVNNVRSAARFLSRVDLNNNNRDLAEDIIRMGKLPSRIAANNIVPDYLEDTCGGGGPHCITWDDNGTIEFTVKAKYRLSIFRFADQDAPTDIPFVIRERIRWVGM